MKTFNGKNWKEFREKVNFIHNSSILIAATRKFYWALCTPRSHICMCVYIYFPRCSFFSNLKLKFIIYSSNFHWTWKKCLIVWRWIKNVADSRHTSIMPFRVLRCTLSDKWHYSEYSECMQPLFHTPDYDFNVSSVFLLSADQEFTIILRVCAPLLNINSMTSYTLKHIYTAHSCFSIYFFLPHLKLVRRKLNANTYKCWTQQT